MLCFLELVLLRFLKLVVVRVFGYRSKTAGSVEKMRLFDLAPRQDWLARFLEVSPTGWECRMPFRSRVLAVRDKVPCER